MTAASIKQLELVKAEPIPLETFTNIKTKHHGLRQAIYRYSNTQQSRRHWAEPPLVNKAKKTVKPFIGTPERPTDQWMCNKGHEPWGHFFTHQPKENWKSAYLLETEGEKCALYAASAGYAAISQPGFNRLPESARRRYSNLKFKVAGVIYLTDAIDGHGTADELRKAAEDVGLPFISIDMGKLFPDLPEGGSIDDVPDVAAAIEIILEAARSAQQSAQTTCAEPVELAVPTDPKDSPAQPSAQSELKQVGEGRDRFTLDLLLPPDIAGSIGFLARSWPTDALSLALPYLAAMSGLLRLGTTVSNEPGHEVPANLFLVMVGKTGDGKSPVFKELVEKPAKGLIARERDFHKIALQDWVSRKSDDNRGDPPQRVRCQLTDPTPAFLDIQLMANEKAKRGMMLIREELGTSFSALVADSKNGSGRGEGQLLELFGSAAATVGRTTETREYDATHVALVGAIQPRLLKQFMAGDDITGKWARMLFVHMPSGIIRPSNDRTQETLRRLHEAREMLRAFAEHLYDLPSHEYFLSQPAAEKFGDWFVAHQERANLPGTDQMVEGMLKKSSAHGLRLAGVIHIINTQGSHDPISLETTELAMAIVDQLFAETEAFYSQTSDTLDLAMAKIQEIAANPDHAKGGNVSYARNRNHFGRELRDRHKLNAKLFNQAVKLLIDSGQGRMVKNEPVTWHP